MHNRLSLYKKLPENIPNHQKSLYNEKQNNQKNLNRTRKTSKLSQLQQCLNIKPVDVKNYLANGQNKLNLQSNYNSVQTTIEIKSKPIPSPFSRHQSIMQVEKQISDTQKFCEVYGQDIIRHHQIKTLKKSDFLVKHQINANLRARMLDWMVEVMESYKFLNKTYFAGVELMDRFLINHQQSIPLTKLHILGVIAMHVATKMEQVYPLKLKTVYEKIVHKKISKEALVEMQMKFFQVLQHKVNSWTFFDLALLKIYRQVQIQDQQTKNKLEAVISYLSKCILYDYQLYIKYDIERLAEEVSKIGGKICGLPLAFSVPSEFEEQFTLLYKNFKQNFKTLSNIFKFTDSSVIDLVDRYFSTPSRF